VPALFTRLRPMLLALLALCTLASTCVMGCASGLRMTPVRSQPSSEGAVSTLFAVEDAHGEPVTELRASDFEIYEDDKHVSRATAAPKLVQPELAALHATAILVDMSASGRASEEQRTLTLAVQELVRALLPYQRVAVYAFDGGKSLYEVLSFGTPASSALSLVDRLDRFETRDPAANLHGAVVQGLTELSRSLGPLSRARNFGTLVLFAETADRANHVPLQQVFDAVEASRFAIYSVGVGHDIDDSVLWRLGKTGYVRVEDASALSDAFRELAQRIVRTTRSHYLLRYCSLAHSGSHAVRIVANAGGDSGDLMFPLQTGAVSQVKNGPGGKTCDSGDSP